ncbi:hypothetical protein QAD02_006747 [Eretmocerus hayati]|uniref:Uncharacterized protein n=1 Tax=Eretmocerus hayati TaxID=131215 RepID=A0ACC2N611_9HYME|nr:hypothetical protein QAD02_006747 [Eretmocerus hayati]
MKTRKSEVQSIDRSESDSEPDSDTGTSSESSSEFDPETLESSETSDDDKSTKAARSREGKKSYHIKAMDDSSLPTPPRVIGNKLNINRFMYVKINPSDCSSRIYWRCTRCTCNSTAITSNPSADEGLIVFKSSNESEHNHPPTHLDVQEAEEVAKFGEKKKRPKSGIIGKPVSKTDPKTVKMPTRHSSILEKCAENQGINNVKEVQQPSMEGIISASADSSNDLFSSQPKLIGQRLCLDGYIYTNSNRASIYDRNYWMCRRYHSSNNKCLARATTSEPKVGEELTVYRGPAQSKHNHPPSEDEIRESERIAIFGNKRGRKPRIITQTSTDDNSNQHSADSSSDSSNSAITDAVEDVNKDKLETRKRPLNPRSNDLVDGPGSSSPDEIGERPRKRLRIYFPNDKKTSLTCVEFERIKAEGTAKVTTSNHVKGLKLMGHRWGPEQSKHHHPPSLAELEDAKESVRLERKSNLRTITQTPISLSKNCKSNLKRSLVDAPSESESSASSKKRSEVSNSIGGQKRGSSSLMSDPSTYRDFLQRFSKNPVFDTRNVFAALGSIYKSYHGLLRAFAMILDHREKIENDLKVLKNDPEARMNALDYTSSFDVCEDGTVENSEREREMDGVVSDNDYSATANETISGEISSGQRNQTSSNSSVNETISTETLQSSGEFSSHKTRLCCEKSEEQHFRQTFIRPSVSSTKNQILGSTEMELELKSGIESSLSCKEKRDHEELPKNTSQYPIAESDLAASASSGYRIIPSRSRPSLIDLSKNESEMEDEIKGRLSPQRKADDLPTEDQLVNTPANLFDDPLKDQIESGENVEELLCPGRKADVNGENRHRRSPSLSLIDLSEDHSEEIQIIEATPSRDIEPNNSRIFKEMSPDPAFTSRKDGIRPETSLFASNSVKCGPITEQEVPIIDLIDDSNENPICTIDTKKTSPTSTKVLSANGSIFSLRNTSIAMSTFKSDNAQIFHSIRPNPLSRANLTISNSRIRSQDQCVPSNLQGIGRNSNMNGIPNDISNNVGFNCQYNTGDVQEKFSFDKILPSCRENEEQNFEQTIRTSASSTGRQDLSSPISSTETELEFSSLFFEGSFEAERLSEMTPQLSSVASNLDTFRYKFSKRRKGWSTVCRATAHANSSFPATCKPPPDLKFQRLTIV